MALSLRLVTSPGTARAGVATVGAAAEGVAVYSSLRDSADIARAVGPAMRQGRHDAAVRSFAASVAAAISVLPKDAPSLTGVARAYADPGPRPPPGEVPTSAAIARAAMSRLGDPDAFGDD
jgi:hypothetical protein